MGNRICGGAPAGKSKFDIVWVTFLLFTIPVNIEKLLESLG
jgi:hypothetical protein